MAVSFLLFSLAVGLVAIEGKPAESVPKTLSLPLHRHWEPLAEDAQQPLPLAANGIESLVYTINVRVGSTAQHVNLTLDTNSQGSVLFSKGYTAQNRSCSKGQAQRNFFDASRSSSYVQTADSVGGWGIYRYPYVGVECHQAIGWAEDLYGVWGQDTYSFGPLSVPNVPFILSNFTFWPLNPRWPSDGIFPLGLMGGEALSTIFNKVGGNQEISLFLNGAPSQSGKGSLGGQITFGGKDTTNCASNWKVLKSSDDMDWSLYFSKVKVGSKVIYNGGDYGQISIASPLLEVPAAYYRTLIKQFNAQYNYELDLYTVDCGKVSSLPGVELKLDIGFGIDYTVPASKFVATLSSKSGPVCALLIVQGADEWVFGSQFLPNRCVHLDYVTQDISFADPKK